ncbi:MAG: hypothetical protein ABJP34_09710 [Erythrobacter sp.]
MSSIALFFLSSCSGQNVIDSSDGPLPSTSADQKLEVVESGQSYELTISEIEEALKKRNQNKGDYAFSVFMHLNMGWSDQHISPKDESYWLNLAAGQENKSALYFRVFSALKNPTKGSCSQAISDLESLTSMAKKSDNWIARRWKSKEMETCKELLGIPAPKG